MKTSLFFPFFLAYTSGAHAQWATPDLNTFVRPGDYYALSTALTAPGPDGSTYISWFDGFGYHMRMQRLDADGLKTWGDEGALVSDHPQLTYTVRYDMRSDNAGNAIVAFQDARDGGDILEAVVYKLDPAGNQLWGADGIELRVDVAGGSAPSIGVLNDDRVVVAWSTQRSPGTVAYQIFSPAGTPTWSAPRELSAATTLFNVNVVPCADGGFWLQWSRLGSGGGFPLPATLSAQRFDAAGEAVPNTAVDLSTGLVASYFFTKPVGDGANGLYMAFSTDNPVNDLLSTVVMQRVRANGTLWSPFGKQVQTGAVGHQVNGPALPAFLDDDAGVQIAYSVTDIGQSEGGVRIQRFDTAGTRQLGDLGLEIVPQTAEIWTASSAMPAPDGMVVVVRKSGVFNTQVLRAMRVDLAGAAVWEPMFQEVCSTPSEKGFLTFTPFVDGQSVAAWIDGRTESGVYAQRILLTTGPDGMSERTDAGGVVLMDNPGGDPVLCFTQAVPSPVMLTITAADGRMVEQRKLPEQAAGQRTALAVALPAAGAYLVSVEADGLRRTVRWVRP